jgi:hypothetical protein
MRRRDSTTKGLEPEKMVAQLRHAWVGLPHLPPSRPQIVSAFLHKRLDFHLDQFEDFGKNFTFSFTHHDKSRCEVILSLYIAFFRDRLELFSKNEVDVTFFLTSFKESDAYSQFRHILQLQHETLFDPLVFLLSVLGQCDDRFLQFFGGLDFALALGNAIANFQFDDARIFRNSVYVFIELFQFHHLFDDSFSEFLELYPSIFEKLDQYSMPRSLKSEILFLFISRGPPLPDLYPDLLPILTDCLSIDCFPYAAAALSAMIAKSPEFAAVLPAHFAHLSAAYASLDCAPSAPFALFADPRAR